MTRGDEAEDDSSESVEVETSVVEPSNDALKSRLASGSTILHRFADISAALTRDAADGLDDIIGNEKTTIPDKFEQGAADGEHTSSTTT